MIHTWKIQNNIVLSITVYILTEKNIILLNLYSAFDVMGWAAGDKIYLPFPPLWDLTVKICLTSPVLFEIFFPVVIFSPPRYEMAAWGGVTTWTELQEGCYPNAWGLTLLFSFLPPYLGVFLLKEGESVKGRLTDVLGKPALVLAIARESWV